MPTLGQQQINIGPLDLNLSVTQALPVAGAAVTTGILDFQSIAPNGDAWRLGRIAVKVPVIAGNVANGITIAIQAANADLTTGAASIAPNLPNPAAFATPPVAQTLTIAAVAGTCSAANTNQWISFGISALPSESANTSAGFNNVRY